MNIDLLLMAARQAARERGRALAMGAGILASVTLTVLLAAFGTGAVDSLGRFVDRLYPLDTVSLYAARGATLTLADVEAVLAGVGGIRDWDVLVEAGPRDLRADGNTTRAPTVGISDRLPAVGRRGVAEGRFLTAAEVRGRAAVALLGRTTAARLFPGTSPEGRRLAVDGVLLEVVGVLEPLGVDPHGEDQDDLVALPHTTLGDRLLRSPAITGARFAVTDPARVEAVARRVAALMEGRRGQAAGQPEAFRVLTQQQVRASTARFHTLFDTFLAGMAAVAFLLSGKVIAGIMLTVVGARRAEIGLRKALGARPADLQAQIVAEVAAVAVPAALLAMALAGLVSLFLEPVLAARFGIRDFGPGIGHLALGGGLAVVTGLLAAWLPARRAAKLDPLAALR